VAIFFNSKKSGFFKKKIKMEEKIIKLLKIPTFSSQEIDKKKIKKDTEKLKYAIEEYQNLLYAENKHALLIIIQGLDASGKDGAIKNVFQMVNPMGCHVISFKEPTLIENKHDFLWRIHQQTPEKGLIQIFNRSHYEDVTTQKIHQLIDNETLLQRFDHINNFEKLLVQSGTTILKFYLHISKDEQLRRFKKRTKNPEKMWKYSKKDLRERKNWKKYISAYEQVFKNCSEYSPWNIIPSDQNWYKEYLIAKKVVETLENFEMKFPKL
jgi:PPK2 family polyphosphate:nucleotide phosphotransferase